MERSTSTIDKAKAYYEVYIGLRKELLVNKVDFKEEVLLFWASRSTAPRLYLTEKYVAGIISNILTGKKTPKSREGKRLYDYIRQELQLGTGSDKKRTIDIARDIVEKPAPGFFLSVSRCRELISLALKG